MSDGPEYGEVQPYPSEPRENTNCPWCDAGEEPPLKTPAPSKPNHRLWGCGSWLRGIEPVQSQSCELNVLEEENAKLRDRIKKLRSSMLTAQFELNETLACDRKPEIGD